MTSVATKNSDGTPLFHLDQIGSGDTVTFLVKVSSFDMLNKVLKIADEMKLRELQDILQGERFVRPK